MRRGWALFGLIFVMILLVSFVSAFSFSDITKFFGITGNAITDVDNANLVSYYNFDEAEGDDLKDNNELICSDCPTTISGKFSDGVYFDGAKTYLEKTGAYNVNRDYYSIAAWIKVNPGDSRNTILEFAKSDGKRRALMIAHDLQQGKPVTHYGDQKGRYANTADLRDGQWHHLVSTMDSSGPKIYLDGVEISLTAEESGAPFGTSSKISIGKSLIDTAPNYFNGTLDEVRLYNRALSVAEVKELYNYVPSVPAPIVCGNGIVESGEECDDGNKVNGDGCSSSCQIETINQTCTDSDGGLNYYNYGEVKGCVYNGLSGGCGITSDKCIGKNLIQEAYCNNENKSSHINYSCSYGCSDGACISNSSYELLCEGDYLTNIRKLYIGNPINLVKPALTEVQLPTILSDGAVIGSDGNPLERDIGTPYEYIQVLYLGNSRITNDNGSVYIFINTNPDVDYVYSYSLLFSSNLNFSSPEVHGSKIQLVGDEFIVQNSSTNNKVVLYNQDRDYYLEITNNGNLKLNGNSLVGTKTLISESNGVAKIVISFAAEDTDHWKLYTSETFKNQAFPRLKLVFESYDFTNGAKIKVGGDCVKLPNTNINKTCFGDIKNGNNLTIDCNSNIYTIWGVNVASDLNNFKVNGNLINVSVEQCVPIDEKNCFSKTYVSCRSSIFGSSCTAGFEIKAISSNQCVVDSDCPSSQTSYCNEQGEACVDSTNYICEIGQCVKYISRSCGICTDGCKDGYCIKNPDGGCTNACELDDKCIPYTIRSVVNEVPSYCEIDGFIKEQKGDSAQCNNNYECYSNECRAGQCTDTYVEVVAQAGLLKRIWCAITTMFGTDEEYRQCLVA